MFRPRYLLIMFAFLLFSAFATQPINFLYENLNEGSVSEIDVVSPKEHKYIDYDGTEKLKKEALSTVEDVYYLDEKIYLNLNEELKAFTDSILKEKKRIGTPKIDNAQNNLNDETKTNETEIESETENYTAEDILSDIINPFLFEDKDLLVFVNLSDKELKNMYEIFARELEKTFSSRVTIDSVDKIRKSFSNNTFFVSLHEDSRLLLIDKISSRIVPNYVFDEETTAFKKEEALSKVDDVYKVIKKGEMIIRKGDVITKEQINKLKELGLITEKRDFKKLVLDIFSKVPYMLLLFGMLHIYMSKFYDVHFSTIRKYTFVFASLSIMYIVTNLLNDTYFYLIPVLFMLMMFVVFWGKKFIIFLSIILGLLLFPDDFISLFLTLSTSIVLSLSFKRRGKRMDFYKTGLIVGLYLSFAYIIVFSLIGQTVISWLPILFLLASALLSSFIVVGIIPIIENSLGMVTSVRLYELNDPTHPLLKRLLREAPSTYSHSVMVGNLAEMAAEEIGADGLILRVGSYFHDVGKLKNPSYFIENSTPVDNPHQHLNPFESAKIILEHPIDGIKMCREFKLPEPIIQLIGSHHGDSVLWHLYHPAKELDPNVSIKDFQYQTPTPKTKEEGILLLADSTEAFARFLIGEGTPTNEFKKKIREQIYKKVEEGILKECKLTTQDIEVITNTFINYLVNSNHQRISYEKDEN